MCVVGSSDVFFGHFGWFQQFNKMYFWTEEEVFSSEFLHGTLNVFNSMDQLFFI